MRLTGIHNISKNWPKAARIRAITDLANHAKRMHGMTEAWYREILDRIDKLASHVPEACENARDYLIKGSRFAQEDHEAATKPLPADKNAENQAVETGRHAPESNLQNIPARPLPKGLKRYSGEYPTGGDGYFSMSVLKTNKEAAIKYFLKTYPWMDREVVRKCLIRS